MSINTKQNQHLRRLGHHLKPVIIIGNAGLTEAVMEEIKLAISFHELVKIKLNGQDKSARNAMVADISTVCGAHHVQSIGHVAIFYKSSPEKKISLS
ncbi:MAG: YhbY family RNA-binding protein [Gammaproteobacteria bacterium]|nr:YhbY family RNA-binding protein [Gammaproteobacteria bacterium]